jgi:CheY-like chemotaxis protein
MARILLADDSPHAQRMGGRILSDEGHEVITVSDGKVAMLRLADASPDLILADYSMPEVSGLELCQYVKAQGNIPVILTASALEPVDEDAVSNSRADGLLKKPFEASLLLDSISRFVLPGRKAPRKGEPGMAGAAAAPAPARAVAVIDPEQIRAAVTVALEAALPAMIDGITQTVIAALTGRKSS